MSTTSRGIINNNDFCHNLVALNCNYEYNMLALTHLCLIKGSSDAALFCVNKKRHQRNLETFCQRAFS